MFTLDRSMYSRRSTSTHNAPRPDNMSAPQQDGTHQHLDQVSQQRMHSMDARMYVCRHVIYIHLRVFECMWAVL